MYRNSNDVCIYFFQFKIAQLLKTNRYTVFKAKSIPEIGERISNIFNRFTLPLIHHLIDRKI